MSQATHNIVRPSISDEFESGSPAHCILPAESLSFEPSPERLLEELRNAIREVAHAVARVATLLCDSYDDAA